MAITLPDFTGLTTLTPQATSYLPQYPQTDPGAAAQAKLGEGLEKVGQGVSAAGFYSDIGKTKMDKAMADADFANRVIPINEALKTETDPEKITDLRGRYREALDIAGSAISNPEARAFWAAQNLQHVTRGEAGADLRNSAIYADKYQAGVVKQGAELGRNGVTDPDAFELAKTRIDQLVDGQIASGGSAAEGEKLRLKLKLDLVGGRIDHLISQGQYDQAQAVLNTHRTDIGGVQAFNIEQMITKKKEAGDVSAAIKGYLTGGSGYTPDGSLGAPAKSDDDLWSRMKTQEKGLGPSGEAKTSPKGGIGVSQIRAGTAQEMAAKLGEPFDQQRLYTDQAYNERLGRRYLQEQLDKYGGNRVLAAAAYNAGPAQVDEWISKFGDPRTGAISDAQFAAQIPFNETRNYVRAVGAVGAPVAAGRTAAYGTSTGIEPAFSSSIDTMIADAAKDGVILQRGSGKRTTKEQTDLYNAWVAGGRQGAPVAPPGHSEHEKGRATDLITADGGMIAAGSAEDKWLTANQSRYNIHRPVRGEPWHIQQTPGAPTAPAPTAAVPAAPAPAAAAPAATGALVPGQAVLGNTPLDAVPGGPKAIQSAAPIAITSGAHKGKYLLLPGVAADGSALTEDQALDDYEKTGKHLGIFNSPGDAAAYANRMPAAAPAAARPAGPQAFDGAGGDSIGLSAIKNADLPGSYADDKNQLPRTRGGAAREGTVVPGRIAGQAMTVGGRNPTDNLTYVNEHPDEFQNKRIFWSTGLMNAGLTAEQARAALPKVREQLDTLVNDLKAQVVLVGVDKGKFAPLNKELEALASEYKIPFAGALPTTNVHPGGAAMKEYVRKAGQLLPAATSGDTGPAPAPTTAGTDTYVTPAEDQGGDYGGGGEPAETPAPGAAVSGGSREVKSPELITSPSATPAPAAAGGTVAAPATGPSITKPPPGGWTPHMDAVGIKNAVTANEALGQHDAVAAAKIRAGIDAEYEKQVKLQKPARDELHNTLIGGEVLLKEGRPFDYNEDEIRHFYPKAEADKIIGALSDARDAGKITAQVKGVTDPEQLEAMRADLQGKIDSGGALGAGKRKMLFDHFQQVAKTRGAELDKAMVESEVNRYVGAGPGLAAISEPGFGQQPARDTNDLVQRVQADIDYGRLRPDIGREIQRGVQERVNVINAAEHNQKVELDKKLTNTANALANGQDIEYDPVEIRHFYTPEEADRRIQVLEDAKYSGGLKASIQNKSELDIANGLVALRQRFADADATNYTARAKQLNDYSKAVETHFKTQADDPAEYVRLTSPLIAEKYQTYLTERNAKPAATALATDNAETMHARAFADYAQSTLAEQQRRGVPPAQQRILSDAQVGGIAATIAGIDPNVTPAASAMRSMAKGYGDYWPQVYGELVTKGKLPASYQVLATMDRDDQIVAADDLSRAIAFSDRKGGAAAEKRTTGAEVRTKLDDAIDTELEDLRRSTINNTGGREAYDIYRQAVKTLAEYYGYKGQSQSEAIRNAANGIIRNKYDIDEIGNLTVRVPKGTFASVERAADAVKASITPDQLGPIPERDANVARMRTPAQSQEIWMDAIRRGGWTNTADGSGLVLMGKFRDGRDMAVERADGTQIILPFAQVPALIGVGAPVPPAQRPDDPMYPASLYPARAPETVVGGPGAF